MLVIGLTGGIGMGKSTVAGFLAGRGEPVIDTDEIARELVEPGQPALSEIQREFGGEILDATGRLDRTALAKMVFADASRRAKLEGILHPRIRQAWRGKVEKQRQEGVKRVVVVIPLLFETGASEEVGRVICVACSERVQLIRLRSRGWSQGEIARRNGAQWPVARKMDPGRRCCLE